MVIKNRNEIIILSSTSSTSHIQNQNHHSDDAEASTNNSVSSKSSTGKICRICHVVESKHKIQESKSNPSLINKNDSSYEKKQNKFLFHRRLISLIQNSVSIFKALNPSNPCPSSDASDSDEELIAPCECRGSMKFVHRGCLNQWRLSSPRSDSFSACEQCFALYIFKPTWYTAILIHPATLNIFAAILFSAWVLASTFVSTGAYTGGGGLDRNHEMPLLKLLPIIYFDANGRNPLNNLFPFQFQFLTNFIFYYNDFMEYFNGLFYGLIFISLTEFIFFTPSFILSFNTLFCIWRIQKYEIFLDKLLLVGFTVFGINRAFKSLHGMIDTAATRIVKLKLLQVANREVNYFNTDDIDSENEFSFDSGFESNSECEFDDNFEKN